MSSRKPASLCRMTITESGRPERIEEVDTALAPIKIGRLTSSHLQLDDASVSRIHAVIERAANGTLSLIDLGSAAGTYVNGARITKQVIHHGDELGFGDVRARFELLESREETFVEELTVMSALPEQPKVIVATQDDEVLTYEHASITPYTLQGYYDEAGNYLPGYYDEAGEYHLGYGYYDEAGAWCVAFGYYDPEGTWVETDFAIASLDELEGPSNIDYYTDAFFDGKGGDTLEVAMLWADQVLAVNTYATPRSVIVGATRQADFVLEDDALSTANFPLVNFEAGAYQLVITQQMSGMIQNGEQRYTLAEAIAQGIARQGGVPGGYVIPLGARTSARVDIGAVTFLMHFTEQPAIFWPMFTIGAAAFSVLGFITMSALVHGSFVALALTSPIDPNGLELDGMNAPDRFVQAMIMPEQEEEEEMPEAESQGAGEEAAQKREGDEGKAGEEEMEDTNKKLALQGPEDNKDIEIQREINTEIARHAGAVAVLSDISQTGLWGRDEKSIGSNAITAMGNLDGTDGYGASGGAMGLGLTDAGRGGGGHGDRSIGMSDVGTKGRGGRGGRGGSEYGREAGDLGPHKAHEPTVIPMKPRITGGLSKEIIQRVVRSNRSQIRYCYEKQLQKNPKLAGTVKIKFIIAGTGDVMSATVSSSDLGSSAVEQCMTKKIRRWSFPEPKEGGIVNVTYPFKFSY